MFFAGRSEGESMRLPRAVPTSIALVLSLALAGCGGGGHHGGAVSTTATFDNPTSTFDSNTTFQ
jgi:hypothetical protein